MSATPERRPSPTRVDRYEILRHLGSGGMGEVYEAWDPTLERRVALKCLSADVDGLQEFLQRLWNEARSAARINSEHVAALYDLLEEAGRVWLVMEFVEGISLRDLPRPMAADRFLDVAVQCSAGLEAAHRRGVVHGDIKPANIMLSEEGVVKILDFGLAAVSATTSEHDATITFPWEVPGRGGGTIGYCAPEVLRGWPSDHRADLYSLGVTLAELLEGDRSTAAALPNSPHGFPRAVPGTPERGGTVPSALEAILRRLQDTDPGRRYPSAAVLAADLRAVAEAFGVGDGPLRPVSGRSFSDDTGAGELAPVPVEADGGRRRPLLSVLATILLGLAAISIGRVALHDQVRSWWSPAGHVGTTRQVIVVAARPVSARDDQALHEIAGGLESAVTGRLSRIAGLRGFQVLPSGLLTAVDLGTLDAAHVALGATRLIHIDVRRAGDEVRVTCSLVDIADRRQLDAVTLAFDGDRLSEFEARISQRAARMVAAEGKSRLSAHP